MNIPVDGELAVTRAIETYDVRTLFLVDAESCPDQSKTLCDELISGKRTKIGRHRVERSRSFPDSRCCASSEADRPSATRLDATLLLEENAQNRVPPASTRIVVLLLATHIVLACGSPPRPRLPGDACHEGTCPDGMRCETPVETYQRAGKPRRAPIKTRAECVLLSERCVSATDCSNRWMDCDHRNATPYDIGFCVEPPISSK